jgi:hypothetical protein
VPAAFSILPAGSAENPSSASLLTLDADFWATNQAALDARFKNWTAD